MNSGAGGGQVRNTVNAAGREVSTGWVPHVPARCRVPVIVYATAPGGSWPWAACATAVAHASGTTVVWTVSHWRVW